MKGQICEGARARETHLHALPAAAFSIFTPERTAFAADLNFILVSPRDGRPAPRGVKAQP